jgi:predicted transcriptional regulator
MSALTVRLPDDKHQRLRALAESRGTTLNRLIDEMTTVMLAEFDAETRFKLRAGRGAGKVERGLALLDKARRQRTKG